MKEEQIQDAFEYIKENDIEDNFTKSLNEFYSENGFLTMKQQEALESIVERHEFCINYFSDYTGNNSFILKLQDQFFNKGYLTKKQIECLEKY